ncbi:dihydropyrimidinase-2 [Coleophoma crateriformis]|uniref:dihydropyrimidinase n=1 Tax=Coleophoma crateriformis TaxID=565419 RepID=A0A3D8QC49_9HELO|nr:dihydropyrimidinase-2 [Coleophoma crateriformis]
MNADLVIRNGSVVTTSDIWPCCDIAILNGTIVAVGINIPVNKGVREIEAGGAYVTPGGVDSHVHLSLYEASADALKTVPTDGGIPNMDDYTGDTYETGTRSAVAGGTTTVITFASQYRGDDSLIPVIEEYHKLAAGSSYCDYAFHVIISNPSQMVLEQDLKTMVENYGITSIKVYMTYNAMALKDYHILDLLSAARELGILTMVHAENADAVHWMIERLEAKGLTTPYYHGTSRPPIVEAEATYRAITLGQLTDAPILLVHVSTKSSAELIRNAQTNLLPVYAETCPQFLLLLDSMDKEGFEGAKYVCSPPIRESVTDQNSLWQGINNGTFSTIASDHAPVKFYHPKGKLRGLANKDPAQRNFQYIPKGLPGVETRLPVLFSEGVVAGRITPQRFVEVTSTGPARLFGLKRKGTIAPGFDADITIWHPQETFQSFKLTNEMLHHAIDYTPFEGFEFKNWPRYTIIRGKVVFQEGEVVGEIGYGQFIKREKHLRTSTL